MCKLLQKNSVRTEFTILIVSISKFSANFGEWWVDPFFQHTEPTPKGPSKFTQVQLSAQTKYNDNSMTQEDTHRKIQPRSCVSSKRNHLWQKHDDQGKDDLFAK